MKDKNQYDIYKYDRIYKTNQRNDKVDLFGLIFFQITLYVVNIQIPYEIFIYVEGGISDPNFEAG